MLTDPLVCQYLTALLPSIQPGQRLHAKFQRLVRTARLPDANLQPYSSRRGEAAAHVQEFGSLEDTAVRGRWKSTSTARLHINEGIAAPADLAGSPVQRRHIMELARVVEQPMHCSVWGWFWNFAATDAQPVPRLRRASVPRSLRLHQTGSQWKSCRKWSGVATTPGGPIDGVPLNSGRHQRFHRMMA